MKYTKANPPMICMQTQSSCYNNTYQMTVKGVLWHSTGANNPTIKRYVQPSDNDANRDALLQKIGKNQYGNDWNHTKQSAGLNAWVGQLADGTVASVQTMPWNYAPWGCGSGPKGSCNSGWIQLESCEDGLQNAAYFNSVYKEACELTAYICSLYGLNPKGTVIHNGVNVPVILCHKDSARLGLGSDHSDVYNWFNIYGKTMDDVRNDVANLMGNISVVTPSEPKNYLELGDTGDEVKQLQQNLISLGYKLPTYGADGDFGQETLAAVLAFQKAKGLTQDGLVGTATQSAIKLALSNATKTQVYRVRSDWSKASTQVGAYRVLQNAIDSCQKAGSQYKVFDSDGNVVYPSQTDGNDINISTSTTTTTTTTTKYSEVVLGSASKDERGQYVGGIAGDQTKKEVYILNWYDAGWHSVIRPNSTALAEKIASACEKACNNDVIGYNQNKRNTIYTEAMKVGLDLSKITTPCDCDCSSLVSTCCICAGLSPDIFYAGSNMRITGNLIAACNATGQFTVLTSTNYTKNKSYLKRGDILLSSGHTVVVLSNGDKVDKIAPVVSIVSTHKVRVTANVLNVRAEPDLSSKLVLQVKKGEVFTIIEEREGWGKLKSGAGWVNLSYVENV